MLPINIECSRCKIFTIFTRIQFNIFLLYFLKFVFLVVFLDRDVQHNVSFSVIKSNVGGALHYASAGEVNPRITLEWNQITDNCKKLFGNFTTCQSAVMMELQNTQNLHFRVSTFWLDVLQFKSVFQNLNL